MIPKTTVSEIMTKDMFTVELEDTINKADAIIREEKVKHIPVLENKKLIGLISERSLMEFSLRKIYDYHDNSFGEDGYNKIGDFQTIMTKCNHVVFPEDSMKKAIEVMAKYKIDCLPVVDWENNLVGILTFTDILLYINKAFSNEEK